MSSRKISADKPWRCINCKTPASDEQESCTRCGDRLKSRTTKNDGGASLNPAALDPRQQTQGEYQMSEVDEAYAEELLSAALAYAAAGMAVFPLRLYVRGNGKKGLSPIDSWDAVSTTDSGRVIAWFGVGGVWRGTALAIDTGKSGLTVIDQDVTEGKNGIAVWEKEGRPSLVRVRTPTGGRHDYYRADPANPVTVANRGEVGDGVDVRGEGGLVIAPPTRDPRGGSWEWVA